MKKMSLSFLLTVSLLFCSCGTQEGSGTKEAIKAAAPAAAPAVSPQMMALFPAKNEVPGWAMSQQARSFQGGNLWEFIDGAADGYLAYAFQEVVTADYTQEGTGYQAVVDVYRMQDPLNAFGIYSQERNPEYQFLKIGIEGYSGGTAINFWAGSYYVKITAFDDKEAVRQEMTKLAGSVAGKIQPAGAEPAEVSYFPRENLLPHTIVYIPKDVLAQSYFRNGFEAKYKAGDKTYKLIHVVAETPAAAQDAMARYHQFLSAGGKNVRDLKSPGEGGFAGTDSFYGNMAAVRAGKSIIVALGVPSEDAGKKVIAALLANIK